MSYFRELAERKKALDVLIILKAIGYLILAIPVSIISIIITLLVMPFPPLHKKWKKWANNLAKSK